MKRLLITGSIIAVVILGGTTTWFLTEKTTRVYPQEVKVTLAGLSVDADLIVEGHFTNPTTRLQNVVDNLQVYTDWTFVPTRVLKGDAPNQLIVTVVGGTYLNQHTEIADQVTIRSQERVVVYLMYVPEYGKYVPLSLRQGMFAKKGDKYENNAQDKYSENDLTVEVEKAKGKKKPTEADTNTNVQ